MAPMKRPSTDADSAWQATMSLARLAQRWHTSQKQIRHLMSLGQLRFMQVGGTLRVPRADVESYEQTQRRS